MKQIKFRAWDKDSKIMSAWDEIGIVDTDLKNQRSILSDVFAALNEQRVLMQFIGLKDKNGKEIYEGDIIKYCFWDGDQTGREWKIGDVYWQQDHVRFNVRGAIMGSRLQTSQVPIIPNKKAPRFQGAFFIGKLRNPVSLFGASEIRA